MMRRHQLLAAVLATAAVMGCSGDVPTAVSGRGAAGRLGGAGATVSVGGEGRREIAYDREEARELRKHLLTSVRQDRRIARGRRKQIILRSFVVGADSFHYALAYGERTGPPKYSVLVRNGKPVAMVRYEWERRGREWQSEAAQLTFWNAKGVPVIRGAVANERNAFREIAEVVERVSFAIVARAVRPAHAQLYFNECFAEYMDLAAAAAAIAVLLAAPDPTALTKLLVITLTSVYAKAVYKLNACIDEQIESSSPPHDGTGDGETPEGQGTGDQTGTTGGGEPGIVELLKKLLDDCEAAGYDHCVYIFG